MSLERIVVHAGYNKTGSTAIQGWLDTNGGELAKHGYIYPDAGRYQFTHHNLGWSIIRKGANDTSPDAIVSALLNEARDKAAIGAIVSTEAFSLRPDIAAAELRRAFERCGAGGLDIQIVFFIRNPVEWIKSEYKQRVEAAQEARSIHEFARDEFSALRYAEVFDRWAAEFGGSNVRFLSYEDALASHGFGLVGQLLHAAIPGYEGGRIDPVARNVSPPFEAIELQRSLNEIGRSELGRPLFAHYAGVWGETARSQFDWFDADERSDIMGRYSANCIELIRRTNVVPGNGFLFPKSKPKWTRISYGDPIKAIGQFDDSRRNPSKDSIPSVSNRTTSTGVAESSVSKRQWPRWSRPWRMR